MHYLESEQTSKGDVGYFIILLCLRSSTQEVQINLLLCYSLHTKQRVSYFGSSSNEI